jgi:hypothetical protein
MAAMQAVQERKGRTVWNPAFTQQYIADSYSLFIAPSRYAQLKQ